MATRFMRVDLSETARDYRPIAVEPGVPMLDRSGSNSRVLFRWLGGMIAEPVWDGDLVGFYVRDDKGGRLEDVIVQPASPQDLRGMLCEDLAKLRQRLEQARGETPTERTLRKIAMKSFQELVDNPGRTDTDSYFFRYRDVLGNWRLIWCWGYERLDHEPAPAVICTDPDCNLLFVRRPGKSPRCPSCEGLLAPRKKRKPGRSLALLALLLLLLLLVAGGWWVWSRPALIVTPGEFAGPAGTRIDCRVMSNGLFHKKDVTREAVGITLDPNVARFDPAAGLVRLKSAGETRIDFHYGKHKVEVLVKSTASPDPDKLVSLELTPAGPIDLPLGQMVRLQAFANYGDGRRIEVPSERVKWHSEEKAAAGLELYAADEVFGAVGAVKAGAGPLNVYATYRDQESNRVAFKSVDADPNVKLDIDVDRTLRISGEPGRVVLTASSPKGDVELVPSLTSFKSSDDKILKVFEKNGKFAAGTPGNATVVGSHVAAKDPATKDFRVCDPARAKLVFDPASIRIPINTKAALPLYLVEMEADGKKEKQRAELQGTAAYLVGQPQAVRFHPPEITGLLPSPPFDIAGSIKVLPPAMAKVEVVAAEPKALRVTPDATPLAPGQVIALKVEEQAGDSDAWQEVRPDAVKWNVPDKYKDKVIWTPPTENLRPTVALLPSPEGELKLEASVGDKTASVVITPKEAGPDAADTAARLVLEREPDGKLLAVGQSQRYAVAVEKEGKREPAPNVRWPEDFENDYVKWQAPVLTAKNENYTQFLRAEVAGRSILWHTTTYRPPEQPGPELPETPDKIVIFSQQGTQRVQNVRFPVGATFSDFKVEVHYPDGFTRFVTKKAVLRPSQPPATAPLTAEHGNMIGIRPGSTQVNAEFQGLTTSVPLQVDVTAEVDIDKIAIEPASFSMRPHENAALRAIGYKDGKSVGDITALGGLTWKSSKPLVARVEGAAVVAASLGQSEITVDRKGMISAPATVTVADTIADELSVEPQSIHMALGEALQFGSDIRVLRGSLDVSQQATAVPEVAGVVRFDPVTHTLHAIGMGEVPLGITMGDKLTRVPVVVRPPQVVLPGSKLVVEPAALILAPGQAERITARIENANGVPVNVMASLRSDDPAIAGVDDGIGRVRALKTGKTQVMVFATGVPAVSVPVEVTNEEITDLVVDPVGLEMAVGDHQHLGIFGRAPTSNLKEMFPQPDLQVVPRSANTVNVIGGEDVLAIGVGADTIDATWRGKLKVAVPVKVGANTISGLQIAPSPATIYPGQGIPYQVSALRGGNRVILTPADGLQLNVTNPAVANVVSGTTVQAMKPGVTGVVANFGGQKVEATLNVTPAVAGVVPQPGPFVIAVDHPGTTVVAGRRAAGLVFEPPLYRAGLNALPQTAKLFRQNENGTVDPVSDDPNVKITAEPNPGIATIKKVDGGWEVHHVGPGLTKMSATLNGQSADMGIDIMSGAGIGEVQAGTIAGRLVVDPASVLELWSGETKPISGYIDPGGGLPFVPVQVTVKAPEGQGIVAVNGNNVTGRSVGEVDVTVSSGGQSVQIKVHVSAAGSLSFNPPDYNNLQAAQTVMPAVMAKGADGQEIAVQAPIESLDQKVLAANPAQPGQFVAQSQGQTQLHAVYRGKEVFAQVSVSGQRFEAVKATYNPKGNDQFDMTIEVLAAAGEGELEYRVFEEGAAPKENWVPNAPDGNSRKVTLLSDLMNVNARDTFHLVIEARDKNTKTVQRYPLTLVRSVTVEQQKESPQPGGPQPKTK
jgi:hypothetical protein